jgi:hypothetical protein
MMEVLLLLLLLLPLLISVEMDALSLVDSLSAVLQLPLPLLLLATDNTPLLEYFRSGLEELELPLLLVVPQLLAAGATNCCGSCCCPFPLLPNAFLVSFEMSFVEAGAIFCVRPPSVDVIKPFLSLPHWKEIEAIVTL